MRTQATDCELSFTKHILIKIFIQIAFGKYKALSKFNNKEKINTIFKPRQKFQEMLLQRYTYEKRSPQLVFQKSKLRPQ